MVVILTPIVLMVLGIPGQMKGDTLITEMSAFSSAFESVETSTDVFLYRSTALKVRFLMIHIIL